MTGKKYYAMFWKNPQPISTSGLQLLVYLEVPPLRLKKCFRLEALTFPRKKHYHVLQKFEIRAKFSYASDGPDKLATHLAHASKGKILHHVISMMGIPQFFWWIIYFFFSIQQFLFKFTYFGKEFPTYFGHILTELFHNKLLCNAKLWNLLFVKKT